MDGSSSIQAKKMVGVLRVNGLALDLKNRQLVGQQGAYKLTPQECRLLEAFMSHPDEVLTRRFLMKRVWQTDYLGDTRTLNVHIRWLRQKIEENPSQPRYLRTVRGVGYRFGNPQSVYSFEGL
jgi:two-component system phosphate regulon response regulator PhoB